MNDAKKILIVDDDPRNIFALKATLKVRGYECLTAGSAAEGIALLENNKGIDIVLMDIMMPDMDGYEAIAQIRSIPDLQDTPVIAVTAQAMVGDREKSIEAGASDYISKPVNVDQLLDLLKKY